MALDRTVRSLNSLGGASSSRVLNLAAIALAQSENPDHRAKPFFESPIINSAIILKHRLRADETDLFVARRALATKVVIAFDKTDLRAGGRSLFVGQRGYETMLREIGNYREGLDMKRDLDVLHLIDTVPSLDPFLLREHLRGNGYSPDGCYFAISNADQQRMYDYAATEVRRLTALVAGGAGGQGGATSKMVSALLSNEVNERLEPLRATLNLNPSDFSEGVFSWRGFLYYKWSLDEFWPNLIKVLRDVKTIRPSTKMDQEQDKFLTTVKQTIIKGIKDGSDSVRKILAVYDDAYAGLIERQDPKLFRDFLLGAPKLFVEMGEKMGAMSHVSSFWQYRFPDGSPRRVDAEELTAIFEDFARSFGLPSEAPA
jgi:hypothetical protein